MLPEFRKLRITDLFSPTKVELKPILKVQYFVPEKCLLQRLKQNYRRQSEFPVGFFTENDDSIWISQ